MQNVWDESLKMNHAMQFTNVCSRQISDICAFFENPQKAHFKLFVPVSQADDPHLMSIGSVFFFCDYANLRYAWYVSLVDM